MIAVYEELRESEASEIYVKRCRNHIFVKEGCGFPCANGTLRLPTRPRPSSTAEGNLEQEDDVEIEEGEKKGGNTEDAWSMSGDIY